MKLVHLTTVHRPTDGRITKECQALAEAGHDVTLIAPRIASATSTTFRIALHPPAKTRLGRMAVGSARATLQVWKLKPRVCHFHDPELIPYGVILSLLGIKVIYDVHEDYSQAFRRKHWLPKRSRLVISRLVGLVEQFAARFFSGIVAATPTIAERFSSRNAVVVQNYPKTVPGSRDSVRPPVTRGTRYVVYVGGLSELRGATEMVDAIALVSRVHDCKLVLAGEFASSQLETHLRSRPGWRQTEFLGWITPTQRDEILRKAAVGLVILKPHQSYVESHPTKLFEYMMAGVPVVCSDFPSIRSVVQSTGCGLLINPDDVMSISLAIGHILDHPEEASLMGSRGQEAVHNTYNWSTQEARLLKLYESLR